MSQSCFMRAVVYFTLEDTWMHITRRGEEHVMHSNTHYWQSIAVVLVAVLALTLAPTTSSAQSFTIIAPDTAAAQTGMTYGDWAAVWWQWNFSIPVPSNPTFDSTGQNCQ